MDRCQYDCKDGWYDDWDGHKGSNWCPCPIHNPDKKSRAEFKWGELGIGKGLNIPIKKPSWDEYFMNMCENIASRSMDSNTKFGAIFVRDNRIVVTSYNSFPEGSPDTILPNSRDPNKYKLQFINHAEMAGILHAAKKGISLEGCKLYIQGHPCSTCARSLVSVGVKDWIIGNREYQADVQELLLRKFWVEQFDVRIKLYHKI